MSAARASKRRRGAISWLPSGSARVKVYAGVDQLTGQEIWLRETVKARATKRETEREAEKVVTKLTSKVDERRSPKTEATVNELLDRWLDVIDVEKTTRTGYIGKIEKHIRPTLGRLQVARVRAETVETLYARSDAAATTARAVSTFSTEPKASMSATSTAPAGPAPSRPAAILRRPVGGARGLVGPIAALPCPPRASGWFTRS